MNMSQVALNAVVDPIQIPTASTVQDLHVSSKMRYFHAIATLILYTTQRPSSATETSNPNSGRDQDTHTASARIPPCTTGHGPASPDSVSVSALNVERSGGSSVHTSILPGMEFMGGTVPSRGQHHHTLSDSFPTGRDAVNEKAQLSARIESDPTGHLSRPIAPGLKKYIQSSYSAEPAQHMPPYLTPMWAYRGGDQMAFSHVSFTQCHSSLAQYI